MIRSGSAIIALVVLLVGLEFDARSAWAQTTVSTTTTQVVWYRCARCGRMHQRRVPVVLKNVAPVTVNETAKAAQTDAKTKSVERVVNKPISPAPKAEEPAAADAGKQESKPAAATADRRSAVSEKDQAKPHENATVAPQGRSDTTETKTAAADAANGETPTSKAPSASPAAAATAQPSRQTTIKTQPQIAPQAAVGNSSQQRVLAQVNQYRARHGLPALRLVNYSGAQSHTWNQASRNRMFHDSRLPGGWYENVGWNSGYGDPITKAVNGWINSPPHRRAMLTRHATIAGVGVARSGRGAWYFTLRLR